MKNASTVSFKPAQYTIVATAGPGGTISPSGNVSVPCGADQTFNINPDAGYVILDVVVNGNSVGAVPTYTFTNVSQDGEMMCNFKIPLSAPDYEPDQWNNGKGNPPVPDKNQYKNNCYRYAVNQRTATGGSARPGRKGGNNPPRGRPKKNPNPAYNCDAFKAALVADSMSISTKDAVCKNGYKIVHVVPAAANKSASDEK